MVIKEKEEKAPSDPQLNYQIKYKFRNHSNQKFYARFMKLTIFTLHKMVEGGGLYQDSVTEKKIKSDDFI